MEKIATVTDAASAAFRVADYAGKGDVNSSATELTVMAAGEFSGATVSIEVGPTKSGPWIALDDASFTAAGAVVTPMAHSAYFRANQSGGDTSTAVDIYAG